MKTMTIIVPCYNEREALPIFTEEIARVMEGVPCAYELLLVDDGSTDGTLALMRELAARDGRVSYLLSLIHI